MLDLVWAVYQLCKLIYFVWHKQLYGYMDDMVFDGTSVILPQGSDEIYQLHYITAMLAAIGIVQ